MIRQVPGSVLVALLLLSAPANGQDASTVCFGAKPFPRCRGWLITEAGLYKRFTDVHEGDESLLFAYSLGWMHNRNARTSIGGELFGGAEGEVRGGVALRWRRWLSPGSALDAVAGVHLFGDASSQDVSAGSPMLKVRVTHRDQVAAVVRLDVLKLSCGANCYPGPGAAPNATTTRLYLGGELGSGFGVAGMVVTGVVVVLAIIAYSSS